MENLELAIKEIKELLPGMEIHDSEPMGPRCSFRTGGPARVVAVPSDLTSVAEICKVLKKHELAPFVLGNGTNVVFPDEGTPDLFVLSTEKLTNLFMLPDGAVYAEAGVSLARLAGFAAQNGLKGLEFASGIPGSVGGGIIMNAGAYGGELKDVTESVVWYSSVTQSLYETKAEDCGFAYRKSNFQGMCGCVVMSAVFRLEKGDKDEISAKMRELNERRREKQPLDLPSAGSAFRRPEGYYAAALIDGAGLKGASVGGAMVSPKHAGFIVNAGGATAKDVYDLMMLVRNRVYENSGVELQPEIILLPPDYKIEDRISGGEPSVTAEEA